MRTTARIGTVWCVLVIVVTAGCGGGAGRLSAPDYVQRASRICVHANLAVARVTIPPLGERAAAERALVHVVEIQRSSINGLRGLRSPQRFGTLPERWIALLDQATDELHSCVMPSPRGGRSMPRRTGRRPLTSSAGRRCWCGRGG